MAAAGESTEEAAAKVAQWQERQRDFVKQTGSKRQYDREQIAAGRIKKKKSVEKTERPATIEREKSSGGTSVKTIGRIDADKFRVVSDGIRTGEVIITDERIQHIKDRHPQDFERYSQYISQMLESPQYILEDPVPNTAVILQEFTQADEHFRLILKLAVTEDEVSKKNSIITFLKISEKKFKKYLRNKKILYKSE